MSLDLETLKIKLFSYEVLNQIIESVLEQEGSNLYDFNGWDWVDVIWSFLKKGFEEEETANHEGWGYTLDQAVASKWLKPSLLGDLIRDNQEFFKPYIEPFEDLYGYRLAFKKQKGTIEPFTPEEGYGYLIGYHEEIRPQELYDVIEEAGGRLEQYIGWWDIRSII